MEFLKITALAALAVPTAHVMDPATPLVSQAGAEVRPASRMDADAPPPLIAAETSAFRKALETSAAAEDPPSPGSPEAGAPPAKQAGPNDGRSLNLAGALDLALRQNPELSAYAREIGAREGEIRQAGLLPNPVLGASASNFGNEVLQDFDGPGATISLSQLIQLGGKRAKAVRLAQLDRELAVWDFESKRLDVATQTVQAFVDALGAQEQKELADDLAALAERAADAVASRVRAGKASPVEETRARVGLASVSIEQQRTRREFSAAKRRLSALWGETAPRFESLSGQLRNVSPLPDLESLLERLERNPDLARWASEIAKRQAAVSLAESLAVPDLTVQVGFQRFIDTDDNAVMAGFSLPLPVFNRNQGHIEAASQRLNKAAATRRQTQVSVATALNDAYQRLAAARAEVDGYKHSVLPGAESAFAAVQKGYRLGKFALLDVLDTQRTLFSARAQYLRALVAYHRGVAEVERLIGVPLFEESE